MNTAMPETLSHLASGSSDAAATSVRKSRRIAAIDWMCGFVTVLHEIPAFVCVGQLLREFANSFSPPNL